jgi:hypothetical protein
MYILQRAGMKPTESLGLYNLEISETETKEMGVEGKYFLKMKMVLAIRT